MTRPLAAAIGAALGALLAVLQAAFGAPQPPLSRTSVGIIEALFFAPGAAFVGLATLAALRAVRDFPRLGLLWRAAVVLFGFTAILESVQNYTHAEQFRRNGDSTQATVLATHPSDHNTITIGFTTGGTSVQTTIAAPGRASDLAPGDTLKVYYDRTVPQRADANWPTWYAVTEVAWVLWVAGGFPIVGIALAGKWFRFRGGRSDMAEAI